jgi:hypothetical protein
MMHGPIHPALGVPVAGGAILFRRFPRLGRGE